MRVQDLEERAAKAPNTGASQMELEALRKGNQQMREFLQCDVCNTRPRDHVISKCWHTFCGQCVGQRVSARSRKCPKCNVAFSASDVHEFYP